MLTQESFIPYKVLGFLFCFVFALSDTKKKKNLFFKQISSLVGQYGKHLILGNRTANIAINSKVYKHIYTAFIWRFLLDFY